MNCPMCKTEMVRDGVGQFVCPACGCVAQDVQADRQQMDDRTKHISELIKDFLRTCKR